MAIKQRIVNNSLTEIYADRGGYLTQSFPTYFHQFWTSKILAPTESVEDYKEVTAKEKETIEASDAAWVEPPQSFIDMWDSACVIYGNGATQWKVGGYNRETGYFELNGYKDITYSQARIIFRVSIFHPYKAGTSAALLRLYADALSSVKTIFPIYIDSAVSLESCFREVSTRFSMQRLSFLSKEKNGAPVTSLAHTFNNNRSLSQILGKIDVSAITTPTGFNSCFYLTSIREFDFYGLKCNFEGLSNSGDVVSLNSLHLLVTQALNTVPISIKVLPNTFARINGTGDYSVGGGTKEEWQKLLQDATDRQITFTT